MSNDSRNPGESMKFEPLFSFYADLANPIDLGTTPYGHRMIVEVKGGAFEGEKI